MSYSPTKYTVKQDLMSKAVIKRIFANKTNEVSADDEQQALLDTIESLWDRVSVVNTDYDSLMALYNSNSLVPWTWYLFSYQTKHKIPYTQELHIGQTETLAVLSISSNSFNDECISIDHPTDTVWWNPNDNKVLLLVEVPSTTTTPVTGYPFDYEDFTNSTPFIVSGQPVARPGRIYKRQENKRNLLTGYDFRGTVFRRWRVEDLPIEYNSAPAWTVSTYYPMGGFVKNSGILYQVLISHTVTSDMVITDTHYYENVMEQINSILRPNNEPNDTSGLTGYISPKAYNISGATLKIGFFTFIIKNEFIDLTTFDNDDSDITPDVPTNPGPILCFNITIDPVVGAYIEAPDWEYYPNIVFNQYNANVTIGRMAHNCTIYKTTNLIVGEHTYYMLIRGINAGIGSIRIGDHNRFCYMRQSFGSADSNSIIIGNGNSSCAFTGWEIYVENDNSNVNILSGRRVTIGNGNTIIVSGGTTTGGGISSIAIGNYNQYLSFPRYSSFHTIGDRNYIVYLIGSGHTVGNSTNTIREVSQGTNLIEGSAHMTSGNTIGNGCEYIDLVGNYNTYQDTVSQILAGPNVYYNQCTFLKGFNNLKIIATTPGSNITDVIFGGHPQWSSKIIDLDNNPTINHKSYTTTFNAGSGADTEVGALVIAAYTNSTTFTQNLIKLNN